MKITSFNNSDINFEKMDENNPYFHIIKTIKEFRKNPNKVKILDIGCGREKKFQILSYNLAKAGFSVVGIDIDCKNEKPLKNLKFVRTAAEDIEERIKEKFDFIVSAYFFGYVTNDWSKENGKHPKDYEIELMKIINSMLAVDGICIIYMNEPWSLKKEDLNSSGFEIIKLSKPEKIPPIKNGLCILKKKFEKVLIFNL